MGRRLVVRKWIVPPFFSLTELIKLNLIFPQLLYSIYNIYYILFSYFGEIIVSSKP